MIHDLLIDGVSIQTYAVIVEDLSGVHTRAPLRGSNHVLPLRDGEVWTPKKRAAFGFSIGVAVLPFDPITDLGASTWDDTVALWTQNWRDLMDLLGDGSAPLEVTRILGLPSGTVSETCQAEVIGAIAPAMVGPAAARAVIDFLNLDGVWTEVAYS